MRVFLTTKGMARLLDFYPGEPHWSFRLLRQTGAARFGAGDVHELWRTARAIPPGDGAAWVSAWLGLAGRCRDEGRRAERDGRLKTAAAFFQRAVGYLRLAEYEVPRTDAARVRAIYDEIRALFTAALGYLDVRAEHVAIPFDGATLEGYLILPQRTYGAVPGVVFLGGADTFAEESYFLTGCALAERGVAQLIVDGPGRGAALRFHGLLARHDYEAPVGAMIDFLSARPDIRAESIGLWGLSMGGYYAPRAAAFEPRVKALCCWGACFDVVRDLYAFNPHLRPQLQWIVGADGEVEALERLRPFSLRGVAGRIACPTVVLQGEEDPVCNPQAARDLYAELTCERELRMFSRAGGGGYLHCQFDVHATVLPEMADWLAGALKA